MKFFIYTLGCKVNTYESKVMRDILINNGYVEDKNADVFIVNSCTVTNTSDNKCMKLIRSIISNHPDSLLVVAGCLSQVNSDLIRELSGVHIIMGTTNKTKIVDYINEYKRVPNQIVRIDDLNSASFEKMTLNNFNLTRAFVKIEDGCENFCSYCIIPFARGKVRSKKRDDVLFEIESLIKNGHKEIVLTGIHTGNYGADFHNYKFVDLLREIVLIDGLKRLRISSIEITELTDEVLDIINDNSIIVDHLHIPLQSGSNEILFLMKRKYDKEYFINRIRDIKKIRPNISITTDLIVGFPGETEEMFLETIETIKKINFSKIHVFPFSVRKGTVAEKLPNHVSDLEKKERVHRLIKLSEELERKYFNEFLNKEVDYLVEVSKNGYLIGHTGNYLLVKEESEGLPSQVRKVKLVDLKYPYLIGVSIDEKNGN